MAPQPRLFCFGLGYSAERLARRLAERGFAIAGTTRDPEAKRRALGRDDWQLHAFEGATGLADAEQILAGTTHLLLSIAPDADGDPVLRSCGAVLEGLTELRWIGYLSTTGVYGDHGGDWVSEDTPRRPSKPRTRRRVAAEDAWLARGAQLFRLAGIYGPGRSALERVASGRARRVIKAGKMFNRIHVDDIATVLEASIAADPGLVGRAFNVADGKPASNADVIAYAAELLGCDAPPEVAFEDAEMSPMARSFWQDNVRIDSRRICDELGVEFAYPDYRSGLRACLDARG